MRPQIENVKVKCVITAVDAESSIENLEALDDPFASISLDDLMGTIDENMETLDSSRIFGNYETYLDILLDKQKDKGRTIHGNVAVIDSYDGAIHSNTDKQRCNVVSFSSQIFSNSLVAGGHISTAASTNILTWQQFIGEEKLGTLLPVLEEIFETKREIERKVVEHGTNIKMLELHDGKMLYLLTQHSLFSRKFTPFLLCCCSRGEGARNRNHVCTQLTHEEHVHHHERSLTRFSRKSSVDSGYDRAAHMDWIDQHNRGISHYGLSPSVFPRDRIRFDALHMKCAITRKLMTYMRRFMLGRSQEMQDDLQEIFLKKGFWNRYNASVWRMDKAFSILNGNELKTFIQHIPVMNVFLRSSFPQERHITHLSSALDIWHGVQGFLHTTKIEDPASYPEEIQRFEDAVASFYEHGAKTFLTKNIIGDCETFYTHTLRYYLPVIARSTFEDYQLGIGVYTMQGFERRNKESKNTLRRFSNGKGLVLNNNVARLHDVFNYEITAV